MLKSRNHRNPKEKVQKPEQLESNETKWKKQAILTNRRFTFVRFVAIAISIDMLSKFIWEGKFDFTKSFRFFNEMFVVDIEEISLINASIVSGALSFGSS